MRLRFQNEKADNPAPTTGCAATPNQFEKQALPARRLAKTQFCENTPGWVQKFGDEKTSGEENHPPEETPSRQKKTRPFLTGFSCQPEGEDLSYWIG